MLSGCPWLTTLQEELDIPYEVQKFHRTEDRTAPQELFDIHPLGLSPVITDGDLTLAESGAIVGELFYHARLTRFDAGIL